MTKKASQLSIRHLFWLGWKLVISLTIGLSIFALLRRQNEIDSSVSLRSRTMLDDSFEGNPKVAFMFITRRNLPLDFLWGSFFENADAANFSIYIHSEPGFVFDETTTRSAFFYDRQLSNSIKVGWGESSMIQAERLLLKAAFEDPANRRFVLLSDSCVPLYNFSHIYNYLMTSPRSFVDSFLDKKEGRYNPKMSRVIPMSKWRKGSQPFGRCNLRYIRDKGAITECDSKDNEVTSTNQTEYDPVPSFGVWITLIRSHAGVVVNDEVIFPVFKKFCKRRPPIDASKGKKNFKLQKQHNCIPDEHYVQTLLAMSDLEGELERRTVTYTLWNQSATNMERKGWHPITFSYSNASPQQIKKIKVINHVYYETEYRTEWCSNNSTFVPCFLFARKFSQGAAMRLLSEGVVGSFDTFALLDKPP